MTTKPAPYSSLLLALLSMLCLYPAVAQDNAAAPAAPLAPLVERLGFAKDAKVLIINGDDFGMNQATNTGTLKALKSGGISSTTIMAPCPWFEQGADMARKNPKANVGVHTTLTSEWGKYKWGPVVGWKSAPSLCDDKGYFFDDVPLVYLSATLDEVEKEIRAQIDRVLAAGFEVTHIDSHMGTMQTMPGYHELYIKIAKEYKLPCRMAGHDLMDALGGAYLIEMADKMGVVHPDILFMGDPDSIEATESWWKDRMSKLEPGKVTELYIHCAVDTPEMRDTTGSTGRRVADTEFFSDPKTRQWIKDQGIIVISYKPLKELQRTGKPMEYKPVETWE